MEWLAREAYYNHSIIIIWQWSVSRICELHEIFDETSAQMGLVIWFGKLA
jgi:hypothetical protein